MIVYCITAKNRKSLAVKVLRKKREGFTRHGRSVSIGGAVVQGVVEMVREAGLKVNTGENELLCP